ncbi:MAG: hypothetical protein AAGA66_11415 [Bacteroidota bacterium]
MNRAKTSLDIPSISNSNIRIAPYSHTNRFMELHKLDYKRNNLVTKIQKAEREIENLKKNLSFIENDIATLLDNIDTDLDTGSSSDKKRISRKAQLIKY